jgi:hypothetical protein
MSVCHIDKLSNEVLLTIFEALANPDRRTQQWLWSCILVNHRWYEVGLSLMWESRLVFITTITTSESSIDTEDIFRYFAVPHPPNSQQIPLLFRTRYLHFEFNDVGVFDDKLLAWPFMLDFVARCTALRVFSLTFIFKNRDSREARFLQSMFSTKLADRSFDTLEFKVLDYRSAQSDDGTADDAPLHTVPFEPIAHLVTDLVVHDLDADFLWNGNISKFKNLKSLSIELYEQETEVGSDVMRRFLDSTCDLPLKSLRFENFEFSLADNGIPYRLAPSITKVFIAMIEVNEDVVNVFLGNLPDLVEFEAKGHCVGSDWEDYEDVALPNCVCGRLRKYALEGIRIPPNHWRSVVSQCRLLKNITFPHGVPDFVITFAASILHNSLETISFQHDRLRPNHYPLHALCWLSTLREISIPSTWQTYLINDQRLLFRLCKENPNFARIYLDWRWGDLEVFSEQSNNTIEDTEDLKWWRSLRTIYKRESRYLDLMELRSFEGNIN